MFCVGKGDKTVVKLRINRSKFYPQFQPFILKYDVRGTDLGYTCLALWSELLSGSISQCLSGIEMRAGKQRPVFR